jgi:predicted dehydrogenase
VSEQLLRQPRRRPPFVGPSERRAVPPLPPLPWDRRVGVAFVDLSRLSLDATLPAFGSTRLWRLAPVMTGDSEKGQRVATQYGAPGGAVFGYGEWDRLGARRAASASYYVVTPNGMHLAKVREAARVGKRVLCEKPMANSSAEAEAMIKACLDANVLLPVAYRFQYESHNREGDPAYTQGPFGALKLIEAHNGQVQDTAPQ